jgi:hypothetical protein
MFNINAKCSEPRSAMPAQNGCCRSEFATYWILPTSHEWVLSTLLELVKDDVLICRPKDDEPCCKRFPDRLVALKNVSPEAVYLLILDLNL